MPIVIFITAKLIKPINLIKLIMVNQTLAVTVERYIAVCRPHQHLGLVTVLILSYFVIVIFIVIILFCYCYLCHYYLILLLLNLLLISCFVIVIFIVDLINTLALTVVSHSNWKLSS